MGTDESDVPVSLLAPFDRNRFTSAIRYLHTQFDCYAATCPEPLPAPGLIVTPEIRTQCERYLPIADITAIFNRLYAAALTYPPIFSSTPFHNAMSWADTFAALPKQFQRSASPARLLETLLDDEQLLAMFLCISFLPARFYGSGRRYPAQQEFVRSWLNMQNGKMLRCLDAACGTGEDTYGLALLLMEAGYSSDMMQVTGWTLEPLEVWAATHRRLPHDRQRELQLRQDTSLLFEQGFGKCIHFDRIDLTACCSDEHFGLILCNGLLGGPIIHDPGQLAHVVSALACLLEPGGILLAANHFHGGWQQQCPQETLRALFHNKGLETFEAGEGIGGRMPL